MSIYPKELKSESQRDAYIPPNIIHNSQNLEIAQVSRWLDKEEVI